MNKASLNKKAILNKALVVLIGGGLQVINFIGCQFLSQIFTTTPPLVFVYLHFMILGILLTSGSYFISYFNQVES